MTCNTDKPNQRRGLRHQIRPLPVAYSEQQEVALQPGQGDLLGGVYPVVKDELPRGRHVNEHACGDSCQSKSSNVRKYVFHGRYPA